MKNLLLVTFVWIVTNPLLANDANAVERFYDHFESAIKKYWHHPIKINGILTTVFDFKELAADFKAGKSDFNKAWDSLREIDPLHLPKGNIEKAFWINVYNLTAMKLVAEHYPIDSIKSFKVSLVKHPWSLKAVTVGNEKYSLTQIEKDILLKKYKDPRIVFAVSCAAVSCPDRTSEIFRPEKLSQQMDQMIKDFFKNPGKGFKLNKKSKTITLAWILKKDGHLFQNESEVEKLIFVKKYLNKSWVNWIDKNLAKIKIDYFDHDWQLNDLALKE